MISFEPIFVKNNPLQFSTPLKSKIFEPVWPETSNNFAPNLEKLNFIVPKYTNWFYYPTLIYLPFHVKTYFRLKLELYDLIIFVKEKTRINFSHQKFHFGK